MLNRTFIEKIEDLVKANYTFTSAKDGKTYCKEKLFQIEKINYTETLTVNTLTGFIDAWETIFNSEKIDTFIHIESYDTIKLLTSLNDEKQRDCLLSAIALVFEHKFNKFIDQENFIIYLQTMFQESDERNYLLKFVSKITKTDNIIVADDGISQSVNLKKGISGALAESKQTKAIITLRPYRTFLEIEQPESQFLFRLKDNSNGIPMCGLFEADGGMWKIDAIQLIKKWLIESNIDSIIIA